MDYVPTVYTLTDITLRASEHRRVVVSGFDVRWQSVVICMVAVPIGCIVALFMWPIFGQYAFFGIPFTVAAAFALVRYKRKDGLGLALWRHLLDKKNSSVGQFFMCGVPVETGTGSTFNIVQSTVPVDNDLTALHEEGIGIRN